MDTDLLTKQFSAFVDEVVSAPTRLAESMAIDPDDAARALSVRLQRLMDFQDAHVEREVTRFEIDNAADARYLKAALADEILLTRPWAGRESWTQHLLESAVFQTHVAGDAVFERIDRLLADQDPARRRLARLYLFALAMGFEGRYRGDADLGRLENYRAELFHFAYRRRPDVGRRRVLDETPYKQTLSHLAPRRSVAVSRWLVLVIAAVVGLLLVSEILWLATTWSIRDGLRSNGESAVVSAAVPDSAR
ncbi:MAG: DotU family type IV/VI secretion system protein [Janthinobacterium lividum]